jgi:hypothetical protein
MFLGSRARPVHRVDNFTAVCEPTVWTMWDLQLLTTLSLFTLLFFFLTLYAHKSFVTDKEWNGHFYEQHLSSVLHRKNCSNKERVGDTNMQILTNLVITSTENQQHSKPVPWKQEDTRLEPVLFFFLRLRRASSLRCCTLLWLSLVPVTVALSPRRADRTSPTEPIKPQH